MNPRDYTASMSKIKCSDNFKNKMEGILDNKEVTKIEVTKTIGKECADYVSGVEKAPNSRINLRITAAACAAVALIGGNAVLFSKNTSFFQNGPESQLAGVVDTTDTTSANETEITESVSSNENDLVATDENNKNDLVATDENNKNDLVATDENNKNDLVATDENQSPTQTVISGEDSPMLQQINEHLKKLDEKVYANPIGVEYSYYTGMGDFTYPTENSVGGFEEDAKYREFIGIVDYGIYDYGMVEFVTEEGRICVGERIATDIELADTAPSDEDNILIIEVGSKDEIAQNDILLPEHQSITDNNLFTCIWNIENMVNVYKEAESYLKYNEEKQVLEYYHKDLDIKYLDVYYDGNELIINQYANIYADKYSVYETPLETKVKFNSDGDIVYYSHVSPIHEMQLSGSAVIMEADYVNYDRELYENAKAVLYDDRENDDVTIFGNGDSEITD
ncbi:MAG: hypothetical protein E7506_06630 [Ruminococcus sp.]|nr:hypothetical protein [Ruminococcus sp.]